MADSSSHEESPRHDEYIHQPNTVGEFFACQPTREQQAIVHFLIEDWSLASADTFIMHHVFMEYIEGASTPVVEFLVNRLNEELARRGNLAAAPEHENAEPARDMVPEVTSNHKNSSLLVTPVAVTSVGDAVLEVTSNHENSPLLITPVAVTSAGDIVPEVTSNDKNSSLLVTPVAVTSAGETGSSSLSVSEITAIVTGLSGVKTRNKKGITEVAAMINSLHPFFELGVIFPLVVNMVRSKAPRAINQNLTTRTDISADVVDIYNHIGNASSKNDWAQLDLFHAYYRLHQYINSGAREIRDSSAIAPGTVGSHTNISIHLAIREFMCVEGNITVEELENLRTARPVEFGRLVTKIGDLRKQGGKIARIVDAFGTIGGLMVWPVAIAKSVTSKGTSRWSLPMLVGLLETLRRRPNWTYLCRFAAHCAGWFADFVSSRVSQDTVLAELSRFRTDLGLEKILPDIPDIPQDQSPLSLHQQIPWEDDYTSVDPIFRHRSNLPNQTTTGLPQFRVGPMQRETLVDAVDFMSLQRGATITEAAMMAVVNSTNLPGNVQVIDPNMYGSIYGNNVEAPFFTRVNFETTQILAPIHIPLGFGGGHWTLMEINIPHVENPNETHVTMRWFNSMATVGRPEVARDMLVRWMLRALPRARRFVFPDQVEIVPVVQQTGEVDCGIHVLSHILSLGTGEPLSQESGPDFTNERRSAFAEILVDSARQYTSIVATVAPTQSAHGPMAHQASKGTADDVHDPDTSAKRKRAEK